ncbi:RNA polymerase sigma factor [Pedobacter cryoconitis]|uniref:RNA polymerase sigma-70 factor (ECF subfamily) n=1 Tax=Pedobacter cryoconitis TaxID=188932 RepID=A0A327T606_9SPHI|nr:RNA polymerase sigma-70 factor [Pedobacter cryoconitis]RAJ37036.1 RNA polymerase sigma-70 factor (ECF subfamily) [Pedobacter cryoconitis]
MGMYGEYSDSELIELLKSGDRLAFTEIYNRYWSVLYAQVYKMLRDQDDAKDVIQEIFSKLWINAAAIKSNHNLGGLLYTAARNKVLNSIEKSKVRHDYAKSIAAFVSETDPDTIDKLDEKRLSKIIEHEIQSLPPKMREIFEMSRKENLSHKEIAEKLNLSDQTVKKQVQNALKIIRPRIEQIGFSLAILIIFR